MILNNKHILYLIVSTFLLIGDFFSQEDTHLKQTHVIIVGVSEYPNLDQNKQLKYADDDADIVYDFWIENGIPKQNVVKLTNENANSTALENALQNKLLVESKSGDIVIIYFAGHGDVDEKFRKGYLLLNKVEAQTVRPYCINEAISFETIDKLISISTLNGVNTMLVVDACRSGSFVSNQQNLNRTMNNLNDTPIGNSAKLLSCGPNEESQEHSHWGDKKHEGHGVFTYFLVNGLKGLADESEDGIINFKEIKRYLEIKVDEATNGEQNPIALSYDQKMSLLLINEKQQKEAAIEMANNRGPVTTNTTSRGLSEQYDSLSTNSLKILNLYDEKIKAKAFFGETLIYNNKENSNEKEIDFISFQLNNIVLILAISLLVVFLILIYRRSKYKKHVLFVAIILFGTYITIQFLNNNNSSSNNPSTTSYLKWLETNKEKISAVQMHEQLIELNEFKNTQHRITGLLISGLNQQVNTVLYSLVSGDLENIDQKDISYAIKCADVVIALYENSDYLLNPANNSTNDKLATKDLYLEKYISNKITLEIYLSILSDDSTQYKEGLEKIEALKQIDSTSAYLYNMAGIIYEKMNNLENAKINLSIAEQKAPLWTEPIVNYGLIYVKENKIDSATLKFEYAIQLDSNEITASNELNKIKPLVNNSTKTETDFEMDFPESSYNENEYGCVFGNCKNGFGVFIYSTGGKYEGYWINGKREGKGIFTLSSGKEIWKGIWKGDAFKGGEKIKLDEKTKIYNKNSEIKDKDEQVKDIDGNTYKTVKIGSQTWFAEDLKVIRFNNGDIINQLSTDIQWSEYNNVVKKDINFEGNSSALCYYKNNKNDPPLYNLYVCIDKRNVCPVGFKVPDIEDYNILYRFLGNNLTNDQVALKLKSKKWGGNNQSGFNLESRGFRYHDGGYVLKGTETILMTSTLNKNRTFFHEKGIYCINIDNYNKFATSTNHSQFNGTIRCIKK